MTIVISATELVRHKETGVEAFTAGVVFQDQQGGPVNYAVVAVDGGTFERWDLNDLVIASPQPSSFRSGEAEAEAEAEATAETASEEAPPEEVKKTTRRKKAEGGEDGA